MIRELIRATVREHLQSGRFLIVSAILTTLLLMCLSANLRLFNREQFSHLERLRAQEQLIAEQGEINSIYDMSAPETPPARLSVLVRGVPLQPYQSSTNEASLSNGSFSHDSLEDFLEPLDVCLVTIYVLGLLGALMGCAAISSEKQTGTLRLLVLAGVSRTRLIVGKWLGGVLVLSLSWAVGMTALIPPIVASKATSWTASEWAAFAALFVAGALYLSAWQAIGLALSTICRHVTAAITLGFCAWVLGTILLPSFAAHAAGTTKLPDVAVAERRLYELMTLERDGEMVKLITQVKAGFDPKWEIQLRRVGSNLREFRAMSNEAAWTLTHNSKESAPELPELWKNEQEKIIDAVQVTETRFRSASNSIEDEIRSKIERQAGQALTLSSLLPSGAMLKTAMQLAGTSPDDARNIEKQRRSYKQRVIDYALQKARTVDGPDPWGAHLSLEDRPRFSPQNRPLTTRLSSAALTAFGMIVWILAGLFIAAWRLHNYDGR